MGGPNDKPGLGLADTIASDPSDPSLSGAGAQFDREETTSAKLAGLKLDHFELERPLGKGGMGTVYVGHDISLDRRVAIKMLHSDAAKPEREDRLLREARAQARLNHPNVVHIYYIGRRPSTKTGNQGALFLAMELVEGESLDERAERGERLDPEQARQDMLEVARGLRAAWRAGIIHRDIKPSNLIRDADGRIKIADFGLAKPVEGDVKITQEGALVGSPLYMAPEQARGEHVDHRTDMYSIGACFFHLMAGAPPYDGDTPIAVISHHLSSPIASLRERVPEVTPALARIIERLMSKSPDERFADYDALIAALEDAAPEATTYVGFWSRAAAVTIDLLLAGGVIALVGWPGAVAHVLHVTFGHAWRGQTLAKYLLNVQVHRADGGPLGFARSLLRTVVSLWLPLLAGLLLALSQGVPELKDTIERLRPQEVEQVQNLVVAMLISHGFLSLVYAGGLILAAFHPHKRALHDLAAGSVVTYRLSNRGTDSRSLPDRARPSRLRKLFGRR